MCLRLSADVRGTEGLALNSRVDDERQLINVAELRNPFLKIETCCRRQPVCEIWRRIVFPNETTVNGCGVENVEEFSF
jgi:hypothetical protein